MPPAADIYDLNRIPLVDSFSDRLKDGSEFDLTNPDYLKWIESYAFVDVSECYEAYMFCDLCPEEREAWRIYHDALKATSALLELYRRDGRLFQKVASELSFLPCLMSWHPDAERFNRELLKFSELGRDGLLGELRQHASHAARQSWPVRYAYAIVTAIDLTMLAYGEDLPWMAELYGYGVKHPLRPDEIEAQFKRAKCPAEKKKQRREQLKKMYRVLPKWARGLDKISRPIGPASVMDYWGKGKEMILEEMPRFHERPEWEDYRNKRIYQGGAKKGAIQHAIFKDILAALKTIGGANKRAAARSSKTGDSSG